MTARIATTANTTMATSSDVFSCSRKGLNPTERQYPASRAVYCQRVDWLKSKSEQGVRWLTIDRPETKNAIPVDGWSRLGDAFIDFESSEDRVLVVTGSGGEFCSGADLDPDRFSSGSSVVEAHRRMKMVGRAATALHTITKPTIAAVDGVAVGAGMNLALGCDVVVATDRARFSEIFVRRGLTVDFGGTWLLPRIVGLQRAKELALSGRMVSANEALAIGLVLEVVGVDEMRGRALEMARSFIAGAPVGQRFAKQGIDASFQSSFAESLSWEGQSQTIALGTDDVVEGVAAFLQKRDPNWSGR
jgi:enoyl-CoA hydratase/carnithine racemase